MPHLRDFLYLHLHLNLTAMNPWLVLAIAIFLELSGTICLKLSYGFSRLLPSVGVVCFYLGSFLSFFLSFFL